MAEMSLKANRAVNGFWLPARVSSLTSSFLLGPTELNILSTNYQFDRVQSLTNALV